METETSEFFKERKSGKKKKEKITKFKKGSIGDINTLILAFIL